MKCPKCNYLGFETGDRCRNCGYDFSLMSAPAGADVELPLRPSLADDPGAALDDFDLQVAPSEPAHGAFGDLASSDAAALNAHDITADESVDEEPIIYIERGPAFRPERNSPAMEARTQPVVKAPALPAESSEDTAPRTVAPVRAPASMPLFTRADGDDDTPLIKLPAVPRAPLSVRRTPDSPRLRALSRPAPPRESPTPEPVLSFSEADVDDRTLPPMRVEPGSSPREASRIWRDVPSATSAAAISSRTSGPARRLTAVVIDHAILTFIDLAVVYFTLRILSLDLPSWRVLPLLPLAAFLILIKLAYFSAFTAIGGQTIGKMASRIRVVAGDNGVVAGSQAVSRTLVGALSTLAFGLGFLPGLFGDGRSLHDRAARTRVVKLETV